MNSFKKEKIAIIDQTENRGTEKAKRSLGEIEKIERTRRIKKKEIVIEKETLKNPKVKEAKD